MKTAAIYCRLSTDSQEREGPSLERQREACVAKANELGYKVSDDFILTEAWTGTDIDRPKLNEVRDLIRQQAIGALVCYSSDRLARYPIHIGIIGEESDKNGVELIFVTGIGL